ncbi:LacI family DNA-binding transcriptional regulator [Sphingomonas sp. BK235]|jgi:LacI family transcriptional regulator|uniref:LacI family DNA-binding transcriptional regulator n=1 Tax=Sphingomonas sp. BK235 TaxID=2512131 RepID=UPI0010520700|nr:LacI family DNA-binding transcriptional regulator [Sphingomonas sp. BK235]TCP34837.1 LacI family transcriptional regulator [Sphingomonas sp. BK235]
MSGVTIKDVAERAGVSLKTVSRVINREGNVRDALREAVLRVVDELNYRPNAFARSLSSSRSFLLGMFFDDPSSSYAADLQRGALHRCRELGYHLVVEGIDTARPDWRAQLEATLREVRLGGAILTPPVCDMPEVLAVFRASGVSIVRIAPGLEADASPQVRMDDRAAAREMTELLIALGHRDIAFVGGRAGHSATPLRYAGFEDAMRAAGLAIRPERVLDGDFSFRTGIEGAELLLDTHDRPTAVFATNDEMALGVLVVAMRHGVAVPDALSVVGFDDAPIARMAWPQLTTIRQPKEEMAAAAVELLAAPASDSEAARCVELPYALLRRPSSGPAPAR